MNQRHTCWPRRQGAGPWTVVLAISVLLGAGCTMVHGKDRGDAFTLERVHPEITTQEDVHGFFGEPTARQGPSEGAMATSWAYVVSEGGHNPLRYLPIIGGLAFGSTENMESRSFAVGFSQEGLVEGMTERSIARYWIEPSWINSSGNVPMFGDQNVNARPTDNR